MHDNAAWHDDPTHLVRYLRWADARGLLAEPLDAETDADVLDTFDHTLVDEHLTADGERFTAAYYTAGYLQEFEASDTEGDTFRRLDARFAEWRRGERSAPPTPPQPQRNPLHFVLAGGAGILTVTVAVLTDPAVAVLGWVAVGLVAFVRMELRRRR